MQINIERQMTVNNQQQRKKLRYVNLRFATQTLPQIAAAPLFRCAGRYELSELEFNRE